MMARCTVGTMAIGAWPIQARHDVAPAPSQTGIRELERRRSTHQVNRAVNGPAGGSLDPPRASVAPALTVAAARPARAARPLGIQVSHHDAVMAEGLEHGHRRQAQATGAQHQHPFVFGNGKQLDRCRIGRQPGTRQRGGPGRVHAAGIHQVARMRNDQVVGIAASAVCPGSAVPCSGCPCLRGSVRRCPHPVQGNTRRSCPMGTSPALGPAAITVPYGSWPSVTGSFMPRSDM